MKIVVAKDSRKANRRKRTLNIKWEANRVSYTGEPIVRAVHGGSVPNSYDYPADTDVMLLVHLEDCVVVWAGVAPANKVTLAKAAKLLGNEAIPAFDERYSEDAHEVALEWIISQAKHMAALESAVKVMV